MGFRLGAREVAAAARPWPKIARLHDLHRLGLPVPEGLVFEAGEDPRRQETQLDAWLEQGAIICRGAEHLEDTESTSGAGLGRTITGLRSIGGIERAVSEILESGADAVLVQKEVERRWLLVLAGAIDDDATPTHMEAHGSGAGPSPLASGLDPDYAGPLQTWPESARPEVEGVLARIRAHAEAIAGSGEFAHGFDAEVVVDPDGLAWLVQLRPLVAELLPGWGRFCEALAARGQSVPREGTLTLDGEHNPAPLSPAHEWLMDWLARERPGSAGDPVVLAGWLYMRTLPRDLAARTTPTSEAVESPSETRDPRALAGILRDQHLPDARARLTSIRERLARANAPGELVAILEEAQAGFLSMIDLYVGTLAPARRAYREVRTARPEDPLSLLDKQSYVDVLPVEWDLCSPSLSNPLQGTARIEGAPAFARVGNEIPEDPGTAATLLGEWDDLLFALGLAPLRELWLAAAPYLALDEERVFLLRGDELRVWLEHGRPPTRVEFLLEERVGRWERARRLQPPARIHEGRPQVAAPRARFGGFAIGSSVAGPIAQRAHLGDLLSRPPAEGAIVCLPALTAHAAIALHQLGIAAVCTEFGGALAHGSLMARELGISALIGCIGCTQIPSGTRANLDTSSGRLRLLGPMPTPPE
jgi:hypothetical protein